MVQEKLDRAKAAREAQLKADVAGGATPEATLDLLIAALKKQEVRLASTYYEIDAQEKALAGLEQELKEQGNLQRSIAYFTEVKTKGKKTCETTKYEEGCDFSYIYTTKKDEEVEFSDGSGKVFVPAGTQQKWLCVRS